MSGLGFRPRGLNKRMCLVSLGAPHTFVTSWSTYFLEDQMNPDRVCGSNILIGIVVV